MPAQLTQCEGINKDGCRCKFIITAGKQFCKVHNPNKVIPPIRPSLLTKQAAYNKIRKVRKWNRGVQRTFQKKLKAKKVEAIASVSKELIIGYTEERTGVLHMSVSYPGYDATDAPIEETRARFIAWHLLSLYSAMSAESIALLYGCSPTEVQAGLKTLTGYLKSKRIEKYAEYVSIIEDIQYQLDFLKRKQLGGKKTK